MAISIDMISMLLLQELHKFVLTLLKSRLLNDHKSYTLQPSKDDETSSTCSSLSQRSNGGSATRSTKEKIPYSNNPFDLIDFATEDPNTPFSTLVKAATYLNPDQFDLPSDLMCTTQLPGEPPATENFEFVNHGRAIQVIEW